MKALLAANYINKYPKYTKPFHIYTDASNYQLGAAIIQDEKPIAYYSKKLKTHNVTILQQKVLLAIVMCLEKHFKILQVGVVYVYTDHKI